MNDQSQSPLTSQQREFWRDEGYLLLRDVLAPSRVRELKLALDTLHAQRASLAQLDRNDCSFDAKFVVNEDQLFLDLVDASPVFEIVTALLGPCIQLCLSQALIRPPSSSFKGFVHTDGGQAMQSLSLAPGSPPLQVKVQYFLTDLREPNGGNFILVPRSHLRPFPMYELDRGELLEKAVQLLAAEGDAVLFVHSLWHGVTANNSSRHRKSVIYGYNQMFMRPYDYHRAPETLLSRCTARQKRLLGVVGSAPQSYYYAPRDQVTIIEGVTR